MTGSGVDGCKYPSGRDAADIESEDLRVVPSGGSCECGSVGACSAALDSYVGSAVVALCSP